MADRLLILLQDWTTRPDPGAAGLSPTTAFPAGLDELQRQAAQAAMTVAVIGDDQPAVLVRSSEP